MKRMIEKPTIAAGIALATAILGWPTARAQNAELANPQVITDASRPLVELKGMLESAYSRPVTYEESVLVWQGDLGVSPNIRSAKPELALAPKHRSFQLPFRLGGAGAPALDAALVGRILDSYHAQNDGPRFRVASSSYGLHIVPALANDAGGRLVPVASLLDAIITVPAARRAPSGHLHALCDAVSAASGTRMLCGPSMEFNMHFAHSGARCPGGFSVNPNAPVPSDCLFEWGAASAPARAALISLLEQSSTTMTWQLLCGPQASGRPCVLNVGPMIVTAAGADGQPTRNYLLYDRCTVCPPQGRPL
jgi:hypothetical protein